MTDHNHPDSAAGQAHAALTDAAPPALTGWRSRCRRLALSYWGRLLAVLAFCNLISGATWILIGQAPTIPTLVNFVACAVIITCRFVRELHIAHTALALFAFGVMLPAAITTGSFDYWAGFVWPLFCACLGALICARARRNENRRRQIWLNEPDGRDILLDSQPFRCPRCDRVHHEVFAPGEPLRITFPPDLRIDAPGRSRPRADLDDATGRSKNTQGTKRVHVIARFVVDDDGGVWLGPRPAEFTPDPDRCFVFAVAPGHR